MSAGPGRRCAWCGAPSSDGRRLAGRRLCRACGTATIDPWPSPAELDEAYAGAYRPSSGRFAAGGDALIRLTRSKLARRIDRVSPPGPVLDVGAGDGTLLAALRRRGRRAVGLERDPEQPEGIGGEPAPSGERWAAVVFWHSLEHLPDPSQALEQAVASLRPGGIIAIAVPNSDSIQAKLFGDRWFALDPPRHLVHLTAGALRLRLLELGLRIERLSYLRGGQVTFGWLDGIVGWLPGHPSLYDAIRRPAARFEPVRPGVRLATLFAAVALFPLALFAAAVEVALRRGGTVYVEARAA